MATWQYELVEAPTAPRARELWLQNAAGFILFEDIRRYAIERIDPALPDEARAAVLKGINDAVYGLMMAIEGVTGGLSNATHTVYIDFIVRLASRSAAGNSDVLSEINLGKGDGMCMGYHGWLNGDFGEHAIAVPKEVE